MTDQHQGCEPIFGVVHSAPDADLPQHACDCHVHVFGDPARYPFDPNRAHTPRTASVAQLQQHQKALSFSRVVLVQPSPYGTDNRCMMDALAMVGPNARGVGVIDPATVSDEALIDMHAAGVRGVRVNLETFGKNDPVAAGEVLQAVSARVASLGWHVQTYTNLSVIAPLHRLISNLPTPLVVDHFGKAMANLGPHQPGFEVLLSLLREGKVWVKLSGAHRISSLPEFSDVKPMIDALLDANADQLIWGSDWPHTGAWPGIPLTRDVFNEFHPIDDGIAANRLRRWLGDTGYQRKVLADNPARLYDFD
jgi:predicted TIM-barrel fold metal-dependent hydrolase